MADENERLLNELLTLVPENSSCADCRTRQNVSWSGQESLAFLDQLVDVPDAGRLPAHLSCDQAGVVTIFKGKTHLNRNKMRVQSL